MDSEKLVAIAMHPTYRILARGTSIAWLQKVAYAYLEERYGLVDDFDVRTYHSKHEMHIRHLRSPRIDFFQPDVIIQDEPQKA